MSRALYQILEWITRFAYINVLWVLFTLAGGILFGLFPATIAMFSLVRQWLRGNSDSPVLKSFWQYYKSEFFKSNFLGLFIYVISFIFIFNIFFLYANIGELLTWTTAPLLAGMLLFIMLLFYLFPTYVHFDLSIAQTFKNAILMMFVSPIHTVFILVSLVAFYFIVYLIPALGFVFGASFYCFITVWFSLDVFKKIAEKKTR